MACRRSEEFETRYQWLRPEELRQRRDQCPLVIFPVGPLEYHGPHLPLGTDPINAERVAHACCRRLRRGVVRPTLYLGTERERPAEVLDWLGLESGSYIVGMDFPSRLWNSHYLPEEVFAVALAAELRILIGQGYRYVLLANGHGAENHIAVIDRLCIELSHTTEAKLDWLLTVPQATLEDKTFGHATKLETALLMHYDPDAVDLGSLPPRDEPLRYADFSIVDGAGFAPDHDPQRIVHHDPRDATAEMGRRWFEECVGEVVAKIEKMTA